MITKKINIKVRFVKIIGYLSYITSFLLVIISIISFLMIVSGRTNILSFIFSLLMAYGFFKGGKFFTKLKEIKSIHYISSLLLLIIILFILTIMFLGFYIGFTTPIN